MVKLTIDSETRSSTSTSVWNCATNPGRLLGYFNPVVDPSMYDGVDSRLNEEKLRRIEEEGGGRPLADILRDLESRN